MNRRKIKKVCHKIADVLQVIFGYGVMICLFVGGLSFVGYMAALIIGGETATAICTFIYKTLYPYLVQLSTIMVLLGLVKMYLCGEVALSSGKSKPKPHKDDIDID